MVSPASTRIQTTSICPVLIPCPDLHNLETLPELVARKPIIESSAARACIATHDSQTLLGIESLFYHLLVEADGVGIDGCDASFPFSYIDYRIRYIPGRASTAQTRDITRSLILDSRWYDGMNCDMRRMETLICLRSSTCSISR